MSMNINDVSSKISHYMDFYPRNDCEYAGEFDIDKSLYSVDSFDTIADIICQSPDITVIRRDSSLMFMSYTKNGHRFTIQFFTTPEDEYYVAIF